MIRAYRREDLDAVLTVWESASAVAHPFLSAEFLVRERHKVADHHLPTAETWVWEAGGRVVGFIALVGNEVGGLFIDPELHRRGIGRALVNHARDLRGHLEVEVFRENALARAFYDACGFVQQREGVDEATGRAIIRLELPDHEHGKTPAKGRESLQP